MKKIEAKIYDFLKECDKNQEGRIDVSELKADKLTWDLKQEGEEENTKVKKISSKAREEKKKITKFVIKSN